MALAAAGCEGICDDESADESRDALGICGFSFQPLLARKAFAHANSSYGFFSREMCWGTLELFYLRSLRR